MHGDKHESSGHRSSSSRRKRGGESRVSGEKHSSSTRQRNTSGRDKRDGDDDRTSDRDKHDGDDGRTYGDEREYGQQRKKGSRRREDGGQGKEDSRRRRSKSRDDTHGSSAHRGGVSMTKSDKSPEDGEISVKRRPTDNSEEGIDGWVPVSPSHRVSSVSNGQWGGTNAITKDRDIEDKGKGGVESSEGPERTGRQSPSQRALRESDTLEVSPMATRKNGDGTEKSRAANVARGSAFGDDDDRDDKVRTVQTAVEPAGGVVKLVSSRKESLPIPLGNSDSDVPMRNKIDETRDIPGAGRSSDKNGAVEVSTVAWDSNDVEVM